MQRGRCTEANQGKNFYDLESRIEALRAQSDRIQLKSDVSTAFNGTTLAKLINLTQIIFPPSACSCFPSPRTLSAAEVYFEEISYPIWNTAQQSAHQTT